MYIHQIAVTRPRNSKTSLMFTLAISFLIFSASSFSLTSTLVVKAAESIIGSDIKAQNLSGYLDEIPIAEFLDNQIAAVGQPVLDYAFASITSQYLWGTAASIGGNSAITTASDSSGRINIHYIGVPRNLLDVVNADFYIPTDM